MYRCKMSPPPTRGSTPRSQASRVCRLVSPAHAGIDPPTERRQLSDARLPRPRGDRPLRRACVAASSWSPPPTRGSTLVPLDPHAARVVSPAHAGIDLLPRVAGRGRLRLPRPRGDRPRTAHRHALVWGSPPPTRGSTSAGWTGPAAARVSPAHAGIDRRARRSGHARPCLPRPRGDRPRQRYPLLRGIRSPPPTRGSTGGSRRRRGHAQVSPAHAGIDPTG